MILLKRTCSAYVFFALMVAVGAQEQTAPNQLDSFESDLSRWGVDPGKQPLMLSTERASAGKQSAYSGPPGSMRAGKWELGPPLIGRVELRFFDDMAFRKQQMAGVSAGNQLLGISCRGGRTYHYRIGKTYTPTPVIRSEGWHLFAWEANGAGTRAFIDGTMIAENTELGRLERLFIGSFWDASTGWYDDVRIWRRPPSKAPPFTEAETVFREESPERPIQTVNKPGASRQAINHWDAPNHALEWILGTLRAGDKTLLVKYATDNVSATRRVRIGDTVSETVFPGTGGWDQWQYAGIPIHLAEGVAVIRMEAIQASLNVDWLALAPEACTPSTYGPALDRLVRERQRLATAWQMTSRTAKAKGIELPAPPTLQPLEEELPPLQLLQRIPDHALNTIVSLRRAVLEAESSKLQTMFHVPVWTMPPHETELSLEYYQRLTNYVKLTSPRFKNWPHAPDCRYHKREGSSEWDVRQNATVALGYAALLNGSATGTQSSLPMDDLRSDLAQLLRTVSITHKANFLPTSDGKPWGDQWQSAFWAAIAGQAAWLVWRQLPDDVCLMIARMVEHEADRFNRRPPDSGVERDTKAEENAWNSEIIALAACMFPDHPRAELWHERAIVYMLNSFSRQQDLTSARVVDGKPLRERLSAVTIHPDFSLENHNRVHPDYLATGSLMVRNALLFRAAGRDLPESLFFNVPETYALVKSITATNGSSFYINGQDWWPHRHDVPLLISGLMAILQGDPEAAFLEQATLAFTGRMHARFNDGSMWDRREYNYANAEEEMIARYAELYLSHRMFGDGPEPLTHDAFVAAQSGVHLYDRGGFITHRTPTKFVSLTWKNGIMGLVFPSDDTWFTAPYERGLVGTIMCRGRADTPPTLAAKGIHPQESGFTAVIRLSRCENAVEQRLGVASLPGDTVVILEQLVALDDVVMDRISTGAFGILNEDAPGISPNQRVLHHAGGQIDITGACKAAARLLPIRSTWANIDNRFGVVTSTSDMAYHDVNTYQRSRLREVLYANHVVGPRQISKGSVFAQSAWLVAPNASAAETERMTIALETHNSLIVATLPDGTTIAANFADEDQHVTVAKGEQAVPALGMLVETVEAQE